MTPEEEKSAFLTASKQAVADKFKELTEAAEFGEKLESRKAIKECIEFTKKLSEAKTAEDVIAMKAELTALTTTITELKTKAESPIKVVKNFGSLEGVVMEGMKNLWAKGKDGAKSAWDKFKDDSHATLRITPALLDEQGRKVDNPMSDSTSVIPIGIGVPFSITQFEPGLTRVTRRKPFMIQLVDFARTTERFIAWVEQTNIDTGIAFMILEGGSATNDYGSFRWAEKNIRTEQIVALSKMTKVMMDDLQAAQAEVQTEIMQLLALKLDAQILFGNNAAPQLDGIVNHAVAFVNAGNLAVASANNYDALVAAILQIRINGDLSGIALGGEVINIFEPTDIVMHPADVAAMDLTKDTLTRYILDQQTYPEAILGGKAIAGLRITENIAMTPGKFLVMDASKSHVRMREDAEITLGYNNTDFQDGLVTVRGTLRAAHYIKTIQNKAFVMDTFANAKAAIQAV